MKIEISIAARYYDLLRKISDYVKISPETLAKNIIETHVYNFDKEMEKFANKTYDDFNYNDYEEFESWER